MAIGMTAYGRTPIRKRTRTGTTKTVTIRSGVSRPQPMVVTSYVPRRAPLATRGFRYPVREKKFFDVDQTYAFNTTGTVKLLAVPVLGTDYTNRVGRKIVLKSVYIRGLATVEGAFNLPAPPMTSLAQLGRLILLVDSQPNGSAPAILDILTAASAISHLNPNNRDRFRILWDKQYAFGPIKVDNTATQSYAWAQGQAVYPIKYYKKLNIETIFNAGVAGTIADINSGALYLVAIGTTAAGTNTDADAVVSCRVRFDDS